jgi:hypothetical protein
MRAIKSRWFLFIIYPHKMRAFDKTKLRTSLNELIQRHSGKIAAPIPETYEL